MLIHPQKYTTLVSKAVFFEYKLQMRFKINSPSEDGWLTETHLEKNAVVDIVNNQQNATQ